MARPCGVRDRTQGAISGWLQFAHFTGSDRRPGDVSEVAAASGYTRVTNMYARTIQRSGCDRASRSDFEISGCTAAGDSWRVIEIVACVIAYRHENLLA